MSGTLVYSPMVDPISEYEVLRYMRMPETTDEVMALLRATIEEAEGCFSHRVCAMECPVRIDGDKIDLGFAEIASQDLAKALSGCKCAIIFAATVGMGIDRLIAKYTRLSPARALALQALGTERIEALCNAFCRDREAEYRESGMTLRRRFSPGYGDLPLTLQSDIFQVLNCPKHIGLTLNDSLLMSPTKSVTAIVGLANGGIT